MKTYILIALCFFTFSSISAQSNALGIRLGGGDGSQAEISYQQYIGGPNRLEFDLAFFDDGYAYPSSKKARSNSNLLGPPIYC